MISWQSDLLERLEGKMSCIKIDSLISFSFYLVVIDLHFKITYIYENLFSDFGVGKYGWKKTQPLTCQASGNPSK